MSVVVGLKVLCYLGLGLRQAVEGVCRDPALEGLVRIDQAAHDEHRAGDPDTVLADGVNDLLAVRARYMGTTTIGADLAEESEVFIRILLLDVTLAEEDLAPEGMDGRHAVIPGMTTEPSHIGSDDSDLVVWVPHR
ncbi:MAG: hypothetical protein K0S38_846 [Candidatus Paceibacter sp.]|nr:hypothetical protein [Candidatus Paceibacter sp.]